MPTENSTRLYETNPFWAEVKIETIGMDDPFLAAVERLAKPRLHLPKDYALNPGHYLRGEPKKSAPCLPRRRQTFRTGRFHCAAQ